MADDKKKQETTAAATAVSTAEQAKLAGVPALPLGATLTPALMKELGEAIAMGMVMAKKMEVDEKKATSDAAILAQMNSRKRCEVCLQREVACKGQHVKQVVFPIDPLSQQVFDGVTVNGVRYCSPNYSTPIDVPFPNDIAGMVSAFERNERETRIGRKGQRKSESWRSGSSADIQNWR